MLQRQFASFIDRNCIYKICSFQLINLIHAHVAAKTMARLTQDLLEEGLCGFGASPVSRKHAYLQLHLNVRSLEGTKMDFTFSK